MGWDGWMVIIGHRSSKSTFGANNLTKFWIWVDSSRVRPVRARVGESEKAGTTSGIRLIRIPLLCDGQQPPKSTFCCFPHPIMFLC